MWIRFKNVLVNLDNVVSFRRYKKSIYVKTVNNEQILVSENKTEEQARQMLLIFIEQMHYESNNDGVGVIGDYIGKEENK